MRRGFKKISNKKQRRCQVRLPSKPNEILTFILNNCWIKKDNKFKITPFKDPLKWEMDLAQLSQKIRGSMTMTKIRSKFTSDSTVKPSG